MLFTLRDVCADIFPIFFQHFLVFLSFLVSFFADFKDELFFEAGLPLEYNFARSQISTTFTRHGHLLLFFWVRLLLITSNLVNDHPFRTVFGQSHSR